MDIDARIQALTVNMESLHANVHELWEVSHRHDTAIAESRKEMDQMRRDADQARRDADARTAKLETYMARMMQSITRLSNIAAVPEVQIADHSQRIADLEPTQ